jgi:HD-like signal output (HDOD) protein
MAGDQALAAMVLKLANSAYYGYARRIESLPDAVVLLGFSSVKNLAITASITRLLTTDRDEYADVRSALFEHSLCTAVSARILGRSKRISGEKAFVTGLLHDLGLIVLVCYRKDLFGRLQAAAAQVRPTSTPSSSRCSASSTRSSARWSPLSGSSRPRSARRCASTTSRRPRSSTRC